MQPAACHGCLDVITQQFPLIKQDVERGIEDVETIANHVGSAIAGIFDKVKNWFKNIFG
jgi:phosphosulfolactate synthase (CoM biosynthesis protein A)